MQLLKALKRGNIALAQRLIAQGDKREINAQDDNGISPLHFCVLKGWFEIADALINRGAKLNPTAHFKHHTFMTPLHLAAMMGDMKLVMLLVEWGADVDIESGEYQTPSQVALQYHHPDIARSIDRRSLQAFNQKPTHTLFHPRIETYEPIPFQDVMSKRLIELQNSLPEAQKARAWLSKYSKDQKNVVDFLKYKNRKAQPKI
ncbi:MAG: ankyrin repeat domain-containing protein [Gammaproteobacteria bacterium]|jgi:ankyrin repeat protein